MDRKHKGSAAEMRACALLLEHGYEVFRNVSPFGSSDIVAIKDGQVFRFDVKYSNGKLKDRQVKEGIKRLTISNDKIIIDELSNTKLEKICLPCGKTFKQRRQNQIFCSVKCGHADLANRNGFSNYADYQKMLAHERRRRKLAKMGLILAPYVSVLLERD